jgi:hypothetical protein
MALCLFKGTRSTWFNKGIVTCSCMIADNDWHCFQLTSSSTLFWPCQVQPLSSAVHQLCLQTFGADCKLGWDDELLGSKSGWSLSLWHSSHWNTIWWGQRWAEGIRTSHKNYHAREAEFLLVSFYSDQKEIQVLLKTKRFCSVFVLYHFCFCIFRPSWFVG